MSFQAMTWAVEFELSVHQKMVLMMLANRTNSDTGRCDPSHERLAKDCGMSKESVKRAIAQLAVDGIISIVHRTESGVCLPNQYMLNIRGVGSDRPDGGVQQTPGVGSDRPTKQEVKSGKETKTITTRPNGVSESVWGDFLELRKAKKAPLSQSALNSIEREAAKAGVSLECALETCCARGWQGFNAEWVKGAGKMSIVRTFHDERAATIAGLTYAGEGDGRFDDGRTIDI